MLYTCKKCGNDNLLSDEMKWSPLPSWCKNCFKKYGKEYKEVHSTTVRQNRNKTFKYKYGITIEKYEQMLLEQENKCLACERNFSEQIRPDVDHNHLTKKVRGILCHSCNLALGYLKDNEDIIQRLLDYIKNSKVVQGEENVATVN